MTEEQKRELIRNHKFTFEGHECNVSGTRMPWATLTADFPGFWHTSWEKVEEVSELGCNFMAEDVTLSSLAWLGFGAELPIELQRLI